jgi:uncharacterized phage protein (TIGR01671 family)
MNREIKFRVFITPWGGDTSPYMQYIDDLHLHIYFGNWERGGYKNAIFQEFTGLKDENGKEIYEGDIVSIKYTVGDFAWEAMDDEARDINKEMMGKPYICNVVWCELNCGFMMVDGSVESSHIRFPMLYAKTGKVIGNIFENPKL